MFSSVKLALQIQLQSPFRPYYRSHFELNAFICTFELCMEHNGLLQHMFLYIFLYIGTSGEGKSSWGGVNVFAWELHNMVHCQFLSSRVSGPKFKMLIKSKQILDTLSRGSGGSDMWEPQQVLPLHKTKRPFTETKGFLALSLVAEVVSAIIDHKIN